jgi:LysR family glycine cleavage system transcriptional activator
MTIRLGNLPPLSAFIALEAVVRQMSFTLASRELKVTQAAVSQQVRALEDYLRAELIVRERPRIRPTEEALVIANAVRAGIDGIEAAVNSVRHRPEPNRISVASTTAFSSYWLMPRLTRFFGEHPELEVNLLSKDLDIRDSMSGFDIGIVYTDQSRPGFQATRLFGEEVVAVCSGSYKAAHPEMQSSVDLLGVHLLHFDSEEPETDWPGWFSALGIDTRKLAPGGVRSALERGAHFNSYILATQAAVEGQGVVLGWRRLIEPMLRRGDLVRAVPEAVVPSNGYDVILPSRLTDDPAVKSFRAWLAREAAADW